MYFISKRNPQKPPYLILHETTEQTNEILMGPNSKKERHLKHKQLQQCYKSNKYSIYYIIYQYFNNLKNIC